MSDWLPNVTVAIWKKLFPELQQINRVLCECGNITDSIIPCKNKEFACFLVEECSCGRGKLMVGKARRN
jgi:hypothetical protein